VYFIYELVDPRDNATRYVGMTNNPEARYKQHISQHNGDSPKSRWIQELLTLGLQPLIRILETTESEAQARDQELHWIGYYVSQGTQLTNLLVGSPQTLLNSLAASITIQTEEDLDYLTILNDEWQKLLKLRDNPTGADRELELECFVMAWLFYAQEESERQIITRWGNLQLQSLNQSTRWGV
jgi:predicted GIY-YIG superfamily endonuclease